MICIVTVRTYPAQIYISRCQQKELEHKGCMHCPSCGWRKGTSWDEVTSNSEEIKPIATSIVELHLVEGINEWLI